jgi:hypothetical protein
MVARERHGGQEIVDGRKCRPFGSVRVKFNVGHIATGTTSPMLAVGEGSTAGRQLKWRTRQGRGAADIGGIGV